MYVNDKSVLDEETGGQAIEIFIKTKEFEELNQAFTLDEGLASEKDVYRIFYGERNPWCKLYF